LEGDSEFKTAVVAVRCLSEQVSERSEFSSPLLCRFPCTGSLTIPSFLARRSFVSGTVTEYGILPPTSMAVLLREINDEDDEDYS